MIHSFKTKVNRFIPQKTYRNSLKYICSVTVYAINVVNLKLIYLLPCNRSDDLRFSYKMLPQNHSLKLIIRAKLANLNIRNSLYLETLPNFILSIKMKNLVLITNILLLILLFCRINEVHECLSVRILSNCKQISCREIV